MNNQILDQIQNNLRLFCKSTLVPCISRNTEVFLVELLERFQPKQVLEIGTAYGYSLFTMAKKIQAWGGSILGCERAFPNRVEINKVLSLAKTYGLNNTQCIYKPFLQINSQILKQASCNPELGAGNWELETFFDFVFIDAQKSEYPAYVDYLWEHKLINKKTILLFDDVIKYQDKMPSLKEKLEYYGYNFAIRQLDSDDGILIAGQEDISWI